MSKKVTCSATGKRIVDKFKIIHDLKNKYPIIQLCSIAGLSKSGYYKWKKNSALISKRASQNDEIKAIIFKCHIELKGIYGVERVTKYVNNETNKESREEKYRVNHKRVYRIMKENGIRSSIRKKFRSKCTQPAKKVENILNREFKENTRLKKLSMDTTYIQVTGPQKFVFLNAVKDLYNGEIVAFQMSLRNDAELVDKTVDKLFKLPLKNGCIIHTDQGSTYTREKYLNRLTSNGSVPSMSRRGNCWDNAPIESFFSHLKSECVYLNKISDPETTFKMIEEYIEFYNNRRIQKKLSGLSPVKFRTLAA